jgi:uncharacterized protein (DUF983 family)
MLMQRYFTLVWRALRLRCPLCGTGKLFRGWFRMHSQCPHCGVTLEREPGFYLGSIYFNYGLTALVTAIAYPVLMFRGVPDKYLMPATLAWAILFPLWFFRYARSLWLGFDQYIDPRKGETGTR